MEESISHLLVQVCKAHRGCLGEALSQLGLHVGQEMILFHLWEQDGVAQSQLIGGCQVEAPTMTKMLSRLEKAGLIQRRRDAQDARVWRVDLTQRGRALKEPVYRCWQKIEERMLRDLTLEEKLLLRRLLLQMRSNLFEGE